MEHQESDKSKDPEGAASGNVRIWATEHKALLISTVIGALGAIVAAIITITPTFLRQVADKEFDDDYVVNYSFYHILLDGFTPVADDQIEGKEKSVVRTVRIDSISKNSANKVDYMLPLYTTGKEIKYEANKSSIKAVFHEVKNVDETRKHSYELRFPIGGKPMGDTEVIKSSFKFINGFRNNKQEWWIASIKYPTKAIGVHIQCPPTKPCKSVHVFRRKGISEKKEILDNPAFLADDGLHILWMGNSEKPDTRIMFEWGW